MIGMHPSANKTEQRISSLLEKTVERNATVGEEVAAVQLAYKLVRDHSLDIDWFRDRLAKVGDPPRYAVTVDGFLIPRALLRSADLGQGTSRQNARSKEDEVTLLLRCTRENGATVREELAAVQRAYAMLRQYELDPAFFRMRLGRIGDPARYRLTDDGFLVPSGLLQYEDGSGDAERGGAEPRRGPDGSNSAGYCPLSPNGRHRMERFFRGTFATGAISCIHCGLRA